MQRGDTLSGLANNNLAQVGSIAERNGLRGSNIRIGQGLVIPDINDFSGQDQAGYAALGAQIYAKDNTAAAARLQAQQAREARYFRDPDTGEIASFRDVSIRYQAAANAAAAEEQAAARARANALANAGLPRLVATAGPAQPLPIFRYLLSTRGGLDPVRANSFQYQQGLSLQDGLVNEAGGFVINTTAKGIFYAYEGAIAARASAPLYGRLGRFTNQEGAVSFGGIRPITTTPPSGFANVDEFKQFGYETRAGLARAGYNDAVPILQGSAVTGKSFSTGAPFDVGRISDFDIALASPSLLQRAKTLGIELRSGGVRTGPLSARDLRLLGLRDLSVQLSTQAGREVNFMIFNSTANATKRAQSAIFPKGN